MIMLESFSLTVNVGSGFSNSTNNISLEYSVIDLFQVIYPNGEIDTLILIGVEIIIAFFGSNPFGNFTYQF